MQQCEQSSSTSPATGTANDYDRHMSNTPARKRGRISLLTTETHERIVQNVRAGSYLDDAAAHVGISERTLHNWLQRGRDAENELELGGDIPDDELPYLHFFQSIKEARAEATIRNLALIQQAARAGSWQAAAWYLERTNPRKWGRHETVEVGIDGNSGRVDGETVASILDERISRMRERSKGIIEAVAVPVVEGDEPGDTPGLSIAK